MPDSSRAAFLPTKCAAGIRIVTRRAGVENFNPDLAMKRSAFHRVSIGMTAEAVRRLLGPPRRIVHQDDSLHWLYPEEYLELVLTGTEPPVVEKAILRRLPPPAPPGRRRSRR